MSQEFLKEVLSQLKVPVSKFFALWVILSLTIILVDVFFALATNTAAFIGSLLSIVGTLLILFSAFQAPPQEKQVV